MDQQAIIRSALLYRLNYPAWHRSDVSAAMSANLGLIVQSAE